MKTYKAILVFLVYSAIALSQNRKDDPRMQLDSMRAEVLIPKLRKYVQQVEKFESQMNGTTQKKYLKQYAHEIVQVSNAMEDQMELLYDYNSPRGNFYFGAGMGPWGFSPGLGMMGYPGNYYSTLPPVYYEIDRVKRYANNLRLFTWPRNVNRKETFIHQEIDVLKSETGTNEHTLSAR